MLLYVGSGVGNPGEIRTLDRDTSSIGSLNWGWIEDEFVKLCVCAWLGIVLNETLLSRCSNIAVVSAGTMLKGSGPFAAGCAIPSVEGEARVIGGSGGLSSSQPPGCFRRDPWDLLFSIQPDDAPSGAGRRLTTAAPSCDRSSALDEVARGFKTGSTGVGDRFLKGIARCD